MTYFHNHLSNLMFVLAINLYFNKVMGNSTFRALHIEDSGDFLLGVSLPLSQQRAHKESGSRMQESFPLVVYFPFLPPSALTNKL